jgi:hypothetical protein
VQSNVPVAEATRDGMVLPECVQDALGELVGAAREGLLQLSVSVSVGLGVLSELLEEEVSELVGPKGKWNRDRAAVRHGHEDGEVTLGGRRVAIGRPRVRTADGESELPLVTYQHFADRDQLRRVVLERVLAGVSTRKYRRAQDQVGGADRRQGAVDVEEFDLARARGAHSGGALAADVPAACRSPAGGRDDRRDRDQGPDEHRRLGDHH